MVAALVDTNVLLRSAGGDSPDRKIARDALRQLISTGTTLCYTAQIIAEFWNVATRPTDKRGGFGLSTTHVEALVQTIESGMLLLVDETEEAVYREWRRIVSNHSVLGVQVYDARLVAVMRIHRIQYILTFNVKDFQRYPGITTVHPSDTGA